MSLDLKPLYLRNVTLISLSIERVEYCYYLPILLQIAEYWGDVKMVSLCKIMLQQIRQHLKHVTYLHLLLSGQLKDEKLFYETWQDVSKNLKLEEYQQEFESTQIYKNTPVCNEMRKYLIDQNQISTLSQNNENKKMFSKLQTIDNFGYHFCEDIENRFEDRLLNTKFREKLFFGKNQNLVEKENYLNLLNYLHGRKKWKGEHWYPFVSKLFSSHKLLELSHSFLQFSQSEKNMSQLFFILINKSIS
jgi:hypothetical protein